MAGKRLVIQWTPELKEAATFALSIRAKDIVPWVFCTNRGGCYVKEDGTANAFDSLWQRFMKAVLDKTAVQTRFQEKDLRKKTASDMDLDLASKLLGHARSETTRRHYRLTGDRVLPHSLRRTKNRPTD